MYPRQRNLYRGIFIASIGMRHGKRKTYRLEPLLPELELEELLLLPEFEELLLLLVELLRLLSEELRLTEEPALLLLELELPLTLDLLLERLLPELPELLLTEVLVLLLEDEPELLPERTEELLLVPPAGRRLVDVLVPALTLLLCPALGLCALADEPGLLLLVEEEALELTLCAFGLRVAFTDSLGLLVFGRILTELKSEVRWLLYTLRSLTLW